MSDRIAYRLEIGAGDLRELEAAPHRSAKKASIWSSLSSRITLSRGGVVVAAIDRVLETSPLDLSGFVPRLL